MKDQNYTEEVTRILQETPSAREALLENYTNLFNVADYCEKNYLEVSLRILDRLTVYDITTSIVELVQCTCLRSPVWDCRLL